MDVSQAIEQANALVIPGFLIGDDALTAERQKNEEAISVLMNAWKSAPIGAEPFSFDLVLSLAQRNREICDAYGIERLRNTRGVGLLGKLSEDDLIRSVAALQHRSPDEVRKTAGPQAADLNIAYVEKPVSGMICGIDLETTDKYPTRGYILNVGMEFVRLGPNSTAEKGYAAYCGLPDIYREKGVPLTEIHQITWDDIDGKLPFYENTDLQQAILRALETFPYMAHNASFEDSWLMLNLRGYAEARKAGKIIPIDTLDICRRIDPEYRTLPHESGPGRLENWARRRGVLKADEKERHLGLEDVDLMFKTVEAEFSQRNMF
ncbi:MAG: 3'-5' exonuclease [Atopobiaceae bacterium]|jgi:hypothetical protein